MDQNKREMESWKTRKGTTIPFGHKWDEIPFCERKIEAEQKLRRIARHREKSLILFGQEKEMKKGPYSRLLQLQQLVEYETQEFLRAQAESKYIASKIAALEKEEKKYQNFKTVFMLFMVICSLFLAAMIMNDDQSRDLLPERTDSSHYPQKNQAASHGFFSILQKYVHSNNLITGANVAVLPVDDCPEITVCANETVTTCENETIQKCDPVCVTEKTCAQTSENLTVEHPSYSNQSQQNQSSNNDSNNETKKQKDTIKPETAPVSIQGGLDILLAPSITTLVLNTTNVIRNDTNVNLTAYPTLSGPGSIKVIYNNWFLNGTTSQLIMVNLPFEGGSQAAPGSTRDYSGYENNASVTGAVGTTWNSTGGFDGKGAYRLSQSGFLQASDSVATPISSLNPPRVITISAWLRPTSTQSAAIVDKTTAGNADGYYLGIDANKPKMIIGSNAVTGTYILPNEIYTHVAGVFNSTNILIYVNGTLNVTASTLAGTTILTNGSVNLRIGLNTSGSGSFDGHVDDVTIWNRSLSAAQIWALSQNQTSVLVAEETLRGENWSVMATPNNGSSPSGDGVSVMSANVTILNALPSVSSMVLNTTDVSRNDTNVNLTLYINASDVDGDSLKNITNWFINGTSITILNMPFEGINRTANNNAWDYSGFQNNGSEQGGVLWNKSDGYDSKGAYMFDGINDYINVPDSSSFYTLNFSVAVWAKLGISGGLNTILIKGGDPGGWEYTITESGDAPQVNIWGNEGGCDEFTATSSTSLTAGTWAHVAFVYSYNTSVAIYLNGVQTGIDNTKANTCNFVSGASNLNIGRRNGDTYFNGTLDEVLIFNRSLSAEQIRLLFLNRTDTIAANETSRTQNWSVRVTPNDGQEDGASVLSNGVLILNSRPAAPVLLQPPDGNITINRTPDFSWNNSLDNDSDTLTYRLEIDDNIAFNNLEVNTSNIASTTATNTTFRITTELAVDTTFFWRVFASDGNDFGPNSTVRNFTIQSFLAIKITDSIVAFGILSNGANKTTPADASPFKAENDGNIVANVTITGTPLFPNTVGFPSPFYQFRIRANETGAFSAALTQTANWNQTNTTSVGPHVVNLNWQSNQDDFIADLNISVPGNESAGLKSSTVTFTITG